MTGRSAWAKTFGGRWSLHFFCRLLKMGVDLVKKWRSGVCCFAFGLLGWVHLVGQALSSSGSVAIETSAYRSFLWRHTPRLTIRTGQSIGLYEVGVGWSTQGRRDWEAWRKYPAWGISASYIALGEQAHGAGWALFPHLSIPLWRWERWLIAFRIGTGLGYVVRPYDSFKNPTENAIGSHWNNLTQFRFGFNYRSDKHWRLQAGVSLTHLSNGAAKLPNFGINLPAYFFSASFSPREVIEESFRPAATPNRSERRWGALVGITHARIAYAVVDGPQYALWGASINALFHLDRLNRLSIGLDGEYNPAVAEFGRQTGSFLSARDARRGALRLALTPGAEFLFGPIGIHLQAGFYIGGPRINRYTPGPWYSRLTTRWYLPAIPHTHLRPWVGVALKAHNVNAEMIALQCGVLIHRE